MPEKKHLAIDILAYIYDFKSEHGYTPTLRQIVAEFEMASTSVAFYHVRKLHKKGWIELIPKIARNIQITDAGIDKLIGLNLANDDDAEVYEMRQRIAALETQVSKLLLENHKLKNSTIRPYQKDVS